MELLEGKYFENTILALKKVKEGERFEMRPEFRAELRVALVKRIGLAVNVATEESGQGWAEVVLRYKYLLAGVPVLAVMMLVATSFSNFKVNLPSQQIVPVVNPSSLKLRRTSQESVDVSGLMVRTGDLANEPIVTFSAESVMPPADVLARIREAQGHKLAVVDVSEAGVTGDSGAASLFDQKDPEVKLITPNLKVNSDGSSFPVGRVAGVVQQPVQRDLAGSGSVSFAPTEGGAWVDNVQNVAVPVQGQAQIPQASTSVFAPQEINGRVEENGMVVAQPVVQSSAGATSQEAIPKIEGGVVVESVPVSAEVISPTVMSDQPAIELPVRQAVVAPTSAIVPVVETKILSGLVPINLEEGRIVFSNVNPSSLKLRRTSRQEVVAVLMRALAVENGGLSPDYYIKVEELEGGLFKAELFEFGQVKRVLILGKRRGRLEVLGEVGD